MKIIENAYAGGGAPQLEEVEKPVLDLTPLIEKLEEEVVITEIEPYVAPEGNGMWWFIALVGILIIGLHFLVTSNKK